MKEPVARSDLRLALGGAYYGTLRKLLWIKERSSFTRERCEAILPYSAASHKTPLMRRLRDVDMWMQENKVTNLRLASVRVNGIVLRPGQTFSYWYLIGRPTARKGYLPGMLLRNGRAVAGVGGGLCQLSNLIFWMTLHTPLTVTERHRHGYDVFPDSDRTQPFGSGATCFYPYGDLMIRNDTQTTFRLHVTVGGEFLEGEWRADRRPEYSYRVVERDHCMQSEYWVGYSRHNKLYREVYDVEGRCVDVQYVTRNDALMMYSPFLAENAQPGKRPADNQRPGYE